VSRWVYLLLCTLPSVFAAGPTAAELAKSIREAGLDPEQCYRVRDLSFQKEDIRVYLTDGYLIFSKAVDGVRRGAVFAAEVEGGDGEVLLLPPNRGERQSLALFTNSANLDEHFQAALMIFTDGGAQLLDRILKDGEGKKAPEVGPVMAEKWGPVLMNIQNGFQLRILTDVLGPTQDGGMTFLAMSSRQAGTFDVLFDPRSREQIMAGQLSERAGRIAYNVWTSFASRSNRNGSVKPQEPWFTLGNYRIDASVETDLRMKATSRIQVRVGPRALRGFPFDISKAMQVTAARIDGAPVELFEQESVRGQAMQYGDNQVFLVVAPETLAAGSEHEFEFEHEGAVIAKAGPSVYFVNSRASWYPRFGQSFSIYDLTFHYPKRLTLVTAGDQVEDRTDGETRITRWRTPVPIRMAGFNLGDYERVTGDAPGFSIQVYGNRHLESALQPKPVAPPVISAPSGRSGLTGRMPSLPVQAPTPADPRARLRAVAADVSSALEFFTASFGAPAMKTLTVAPIPGTFGQGFPGLVYLSTLSYLDPSQRPAVVRDQEHQVFFSELIEAHEVAHQWWGNVVTTNSYQDEWLPEALSSYSALMWLERKKGPKAVDEVLEAYREHLTKDVEGRTLESAGPITWGVRLESTGVRDAWRSITYEKGAWIFHMLRRRMGDAPFLKMLSEMRRRYEFRSISTDDFRALAKEFLTGKGTAGVIDGFFDNWIYSTGIPTLKVKYSVKGVAPSLRVSGTVTQTGVDDDFAAEVPVQIQFAKGTPQTIWVHASSDPAGFSVVVKQPAVKVVIPGSVLAKR
jgi:hypothetical protein